MYNLKIRRVGNSLGVTIPKAALEELNVGEGDVLYLTKIGRASCRERV